MSPVTSTVYVPEGSFGVLDQGEIPAETADWSNGLVAPMRTGALVGVGIHTGTVRVSAEACPGPPPAPGGGTWEEIVEVTVHVPHGLLRVDSLHTGVVDELPLLRVQGPGSYRMRVHTRGRENAYDKVTKVPVEDYLLQTWPDPTPRSITIIQGSERIKGSLRTAQPLEENPTPPPP
ncbi:hypothetical protein ACIQNG_35545 [Streptomyces sp. NPDC091377]|uniref:hypothetical protein n=1 Tax=Streptomyces sp. NPDC091377 TaxID=3365995 RepID=UPI003807BCFF